MLEYCPRGSLFQLLVKKKLRLPLLTIVGMARDAAQGILHLHKVSEVLFPLLKYVNDDSVS